LLWGAIVAGGGYAYWRKHKQAKEHEAAAGLAKQRESEQRAVARDAVRHAQTMEATVANERQRADVAEVRARKLAIDLAGRANRDIADLLRETVPPLRFEGCVAAATNGVDICIDLAWLLRGIVDPSAEEGGIWGRVFGVVAHEWYHFQDNARGTRPSHEEELHADWFAGRQLARRGVSPEPFADLLRRFPQSLTHPIGQLRANTMLRGWTFEKQQKGASAVGGPTSTISAPVVEAAVTVPEVHVAPTPRRRTRKGAAKKGAAKKGAAKKGAAKKGAAKKGAAKKGAAKKGAAKKGAAKKGASS
jgi:hypothetical protein